MPKGRPPKDENPYITHKILIYGKNNCFIHKRPRSSVWQYYLQIDGEGTIKKSTRVQGDRNDINVGKEEAILFAEEQFLKAKGRMQGGMRAIVKKGLFDLMDDFLKEEKKRVKPYPVDGFITKGTLRAMSGRLDHLKKFYKNKNVPLEKLDYDKLYDYPYWRNTKTSTNTPPKYQQSISQELSTFRMYFRFLVKKGLILKVPEFKKVVRERRKDSRRDYLNQREYKAMMPTLYSWAKSKTATPSQTYNRHVLINCILIMTNSLLRKGTLRNLVWGDLEEADNLTKEEQKIGHLIRVRKEAVKVGTSRTVLSPTVEHFNRIRELSGIPKVPKSKFPHVPLEYMNRPIIKKFNKDERMGDGTWEREWKKIKDLCQARYWGSKNITWYSFRHTGISFAVGRDVSLIKLSETAGTSLKEIELTYYHHEQESKKTWDELTKNRTFYRKKYKEDLLPNEKLLGIEE